MKHMKYEKYTVSFLYDRAGMKFQLFKFIQFNPNLFQ